MELPAADSVVVKGEGSTLHLENGYEFV